ncbi:putative serine dehydratase domain-containing protein [Stachybotrys elegans]|uniref:Serine dehydratase domain-containing protein n=1 Tax=Stachybotrys elegans TaxID=80388 RepID=A0A8K0SGS0_9HYPO|nr:putative serine dehydratase domain-containing protein [Stachybotrys elegans]
MSFPQRLAPGLDQLRKFYVGKDINQVPKPAVILDRAIMRRHCDSLLEAVGELGVGFRAHVKTHKTREGLVLQMEKNQHDVDIVVSTVAELEFMLPPLRDFQRKGRRVNVLYGIPLPSSQVPRLAAVAAQLGRGAITVMIDHADQLALVEQFNDLAGFPACIFIKVDTGYHRAGLPPSGLNKDDLIPRVAHLESQGKAQLLGLYSHSSLSYNDSTPEEAMANLEGEINGCLEALNKNSHLFPQDKELVISTGASPQVTAIENLRESSSTAHESRRSLLATIERVKAAQPGGLRTSLELHAGVYSILDVQQLSTKSRAYLGSYEEEIAISVMTEVSSVYNNGERDQPEALLGIGVLGLGREPCFAYKGWGIVHRDAYSPNQEPDHRLIVSRVSQEHAIVAWDGTAASQDVAIPLHVGQSVRILPNHACVTGAMYDWYLIVDSSSSESTTEIVDVWVRASGW